MGVFRFELSKETEKKRLSVLNTWKYGREEDPENGLKARATLQESSGERSVALIYWVQRQDEVI